MAELEQVYVKQYGANVYQLAQQKGSRLRPYVTMEPMKGDERFFDRVKPTVAVRADSKYADTPLIPTEFDRRALRASEYVWSDMIDWKDDLNLLIDPTSSIVEAGGYALGRIIDEVIIKHGFSGNAYEGAQGTTPVSFPSSQQIAVDHETGGSNSGLTIEKLIAAKSLFGQNDIDTDDPRNELFLAVTQTQLDDLLKLTKVQDINYNAVRALVEGTIKKFMGFTFIRTGLLEKSASGASTVRTCAAWCKSGIVLCLPQEITMRIGERQDKCYNWNAFAKMKAGATRIEDKKVVQIFCAE